MKVTLKNVSNEDIILDIGAIPAGESVSFKASKIMDSDSDIDTLMSDGKLQIDASGFKHGGRMEGARPPIIVSPNGTMYMITVNDAGTLATSALANKEV